MDKKITITEKQIAQCFTEWAKDWEEHPEKYGEICGNEEYGDACAKELIRRVENLDK